jgi:xylulokinase
MSAPILLGLDLGTSCAKGAALDRDGTVRHAFEIPYRYEVPQAGWAEADAETWWLAVRDLLGRLASAVGAASVTAVGITGQAPTLLAVDGDGRPLRPAILWLDVRAEDEARRMGDRLGVAAAEHVGGNRLHPYYLGPKLAWLHRHEPAVLEKAAVILQSHSLPVMRLTGARVTDCSSAALATPLYDARARTWSTEACAQVAVPRRLLPEIRPAHAVAGAVTAGAARETGLREGTPVVVGGADFAASTLAAGVSEPGEACLMLGTAGNLVMPFTAPPFDPRLINAHHVGCDRYLALGATLAGAVPEWFRSWAAPGVGLDVLEAEAAAVPAGSDGVTLLPYLQGERTPVWDAGARGIFAGLTLAHGRGHLYRSVLEAVAVSFRHCAEVAREGGLVLHEVIAVNGGARSALWRQILADALGAELRYVPASPGAPAGAALLAGLGTGVLAGIEAAKRWRGPLVRHVPDASRTAVYARLLASRRELYAAVRGVA